MASEAGWYIGREDISSVATAKGGSSPELQDVVFQWPGKSGANPNSKPTVATADITGLTAIVGGPYPTQAAALKAAGQDPHTTSGLPGVNKPAPATGQAGSSNGVTPSILPNLEGFFGALSSLNLWVRVAKIVIGGTLLIVGAAKLTGADQAVSVLGNAVAKAPLL